jgi:predicted acylesterase/phospholipase RssA
MRNAARATSAAPTYFEPETIKNEKDFYALIDGGVFANNPSMCALVDAMYEFGSRMDQVFMVSLGTGCGPQRPLEYERVRNWGVLNWAQPILTLVFQGVSDTVHYQTKRMLNGTQEAGRYFRLQADNLDKSSYRLDNIGAPNILRLRQCAENFIEQPERKKDLALICKRLTEYARESKVRRRRKPLAA